MGFKVGFHGFYGFYAYKLWKMYKGEPLVFFQGPKPYVWVKNVIPETRNAIILEKPIFLGVRGLKVPPKAPKMNILFQKLHRV